jgi:hypothetical protein
MRFFGGSPGWTALRIAPILRRCKQVVDVGQALPPADSLCSTAESFPTGIPANNA